MSHFAQIENNIVIRVIVVSDTDILDESGNKSEEIGVIFCKDLLGGELWVQTSYNSNFRKNYAGIGFTFDSERNAFIPPQPYPSWTLNEDTCRWECPVPYPNDDKDYRWNESTVSWDEVE